MVQRIDRDLSRFRQVVRGIVKKELRKYMSTGELVASLQFLNMLVWPVQSLSEMIASGQRAFVSAARVWNVLQEEPTITEAPHAKHMPHGGGEIARLSVVEQPVWRDGKDPAVRFR